MSTTTFSSTFRGDNDRCVGRSKVGHCGRKKKRKEKKKKGRERKCIARLTTVVVRVSGCKEKREIGVTISLKQNVEDLWGGETRRERQFLDENR